MNIAVLVSGGVDSSVALKLLKEQGHNVTAFYLKIWLEDELAFLGNCPWEEDLSFVKQVCQDLNVDLKIVPLQKEYHAQVVKYTINEVELGRTPNPDIFCNKQIKFGAFLDYINNNYKNKFDKIATGHYANICEIGNKYYLKTAPDKIKDQTYFLSYLSQEQLSKIICPIGQYSKQEVRELASKYNLANKDRKDSQGICFLGKLKFSEFIKHHLGEKSGDIIELETNKKWGEHKGYWFYTIGQRQGLGLGEGPWYVVNKDIKNNIIYISRDYFAEDKARDNFIVSDLNLINFSLEDLVNIKDLKVKLRHGPEYHKCKISILDNNKNNKLKVNLLERDQGIAAGQFAVFYQDDICLGSGIISD